MNWASYAIEKLSKGEDAKLTPHGNSMAGRVNNGDTVTVSPCSPQDLKIGDVVLVKVKGTVYLHLIKAIGPRGFLIGNNKGGINGWSKTIYGVMTKLESR